jgi:shikimate dehydrogenase
MIRACVIGHPLKTTLSPVIHNYWFDTYGIKGRYEALPVPPDGLAQELKRLQSENYAGCNVTIPHKETILPLCRTLDESARTIGAANTILFTPEGLEGHNTDAFGYIENLRSHIPDMDWRGTNALVLGAGGAARAIIHALRQQGVSRIIIVNRSRGRADTLAKEFSCQPDDWDNRHKALAAATLVINTTSLGMGGQPPLDLDLSHLKKDAIVSDIVYAPLMTPLLKAAQEKGNRIVTGIGMLLHQARPAFQAWTGVMPDVTKDLETLVLRGAL